MKAGDTRGRGEEASAQFFVGTAAQSGEQINDFATGKVRPQARIRKEDGIAIALDVLETL